MEIEYVRVYKKEGEKASPIKIFSGSKNQICSSSNSSETSNSVLLANYYPDAVYTWSSSAFEFEPYEKPGCLPEHHREKVKIWIKQNIQPNHSYPIYLTTSLPYHIEYDTVYYFITANVPPIPPNFFLASGIYGTGCFFEISNPINNSTTLRCEYYDDELSIWLEAKIKTIGGQRYAFFGYYQPSTFVNIHYREYNSCGYSQVRNSSLTTPPPPTNPPCGW